MKIYFIPFLLLFFCSLADAQDQLDTMFVGKKVITLSDVVIDRNLNVPGFINKIKNDSSYYKAFKNLHIIGFTAMNDIRLLDKKGGLDASLFSKTKQLRNNNCRSMQVLEETVTGDFYTVDRQYNYYTAQMYASLFFTSGSVCNETNVVAGTEFSTDGKKGLDKHKEQLKMLFFNPGKKISGLPFMSNKTAIYDDDMADKYDMSIDMDIYNKTSCYIFTQKVKPDRSDGVIVDEMITWFDEKTFEVVARKYSLSYDATVYDFKVEMEVQMTQFGNLTVPSMIRYNGNWKAITKKRERGVFTATLSAFE
ncbi:MAG: hypothetical protein ACOYLO_09160 [Ferruginibacter sp.]